MTPTDTDDTNGEQPNAGAENRCHGGVAPRARWPFSVTL